MRVRFLRLFLFSTLLIAASHVRAVAQSCPWMTQGSADKLLGGSAMATIQIVDDKQGSCSFIRSDGNANYGLAIAVSHEAVGVCPEGSMTIKGIGNEARSCYLNRSASMSVERISSRVRDAFFTVTLSVVESKNGGMTEEMRHDILDQVAELVAGNLF
jgi:hypothetical protein